ncbi:MAG: acyl-CoA dehydrogenase, partial [Deltaproteobacteria bacterium]|nr:acyl-CoA dehydrogenase [Deltaproteobacteria bacterium]
VEIPDEPLAFQTHMVEMTRKAALLIAGVAAQKFMDKLIEEQEVMARLADICIELFTMESGLLRAKKKLARDAEGADLYVAMVEAYLDETLPRIAAWCTQVLARCEEGDMLRTQLMALRKFTKNQPIDVISRKRVVISRKRVVAQKVIDREGYPLD